MIFVLNEIADLGLIDGQMWVLEEDMDDDMYEDLDDDDAEKVLKTTKFTVYKFTQEGQIFKAEEVLRKTPEELILWKSLILHGANRLAGIEKDFTLNMSMA